MVKKDSEIELARYHTFQWLTQNQVRELRLEDPYTNDVTSAPVRVVIRPELESRIRPLVEADLRTQGLVSSRSTPPDFYVTYYGKAKNEDWVSSWSGITPGIWRTPVVIFPNYSLGAARDSRDNVVYLTFYDRRTKRPAWTGSIDRSNYGKSLDDATLSSEINDLTRAFQKSQ
jgi:hypothetical protein